VSLEQEERIQELERALKKRLVEGHKRRTGYGPSSVFVKVIGNMIYAKFTGFLSPLEKDWVAADNQTDLLIQTRMLMARSIIEEEGLAATAGSPVVDIVLAMEPSKDTGYIILICVDDLVPGDELQPVCAIAESIRGILVNHHRDLAGRSGSDLMLRTIGNAVIGEVKGFLTPMESELASQSPTVVKEMGNLIAASILANPELSSTCGSKPLQLKWHLCPRTGNVYFMIIFEKDIAGTSEQ
jgi:uncharacterized protein YbcI